MTIRQRVGIAEWRVAETPAILVAYGLGSCVGIVLYDPEGRIGGLAHTLLPAPRPGLEDVRPAKFVESALRVMVEALVQKGADKSRLGAKIVGGANMFAPVYHPAQESIGTRNVQAARRTLEALGIPLLGEDTGGDHGRTLEFDLATGQVHVRTVRERDNLTTL